MSPTQNKSSIDETSLIKEISQTDEHKITQIQNEKKKKKNPIHPKKQKNFQTHVFDQNSNQKTIHIIS